MAREPFAMIEPPRETMPVTRLAVIGHSAAAPPALDWWKIVHTLFSLLNQRCHEKISQVQIFRDASDLFNALVNSTVANRPTGELAVIHSRVFMDVLAGGQGPSPCRAPANCPRSFSRPSSSMEEPRAGVPICVDLHPGSCGPMINRLQLPGD